MLLAFRRFRFSAWGRSARLERDGRLEEAISVKEPADHLLIQGNFAPAQSGRVLRATTRILGLLFGFFVLGALIVYGIKVHYEDDINETSKTTRELSEKNKELQVKLNHIRSYKNVEAAAAKVPHLHLAETIIDIPAPQQTENLPPMPKPRKEFPRFYGY